MNTPPPTPTIAARTPTGKAKSGSKTKSIGVSNCLFLFKTFLERIIFVFTLLNP